MLDPRWEDDTLFLIFEEDFRFRPEEAPGRRPSTELTEEFEDPAPNVATGSSGEPNPKVRHKKPL